MKPHRQDAIWTRNFTLLCLTNLAFFLSAHMLTPILPVYLLQIGGRSRDVGYVMGAYTIGALVMRPLAGRMVDSLGRKRIAVLALVAAVAITVFYRYAASVPALMLVRGLHGLAFGVIGTAIGTIVADVLPAGRFSEGMGYFGLTASLSMAISPTVGFWLVNGAGFSVMFIGVVLMMVLSLGFCLPVQSTDHLVVNRGGTVRAATGSRRRKPALLERTALPASGIMFFVATIFGTVLSFVSLYAAEQGIANIGPFFTANALAMLATRLFAGRWDDSGSTERVLAVAHLSLLAGVVALGFSSSMAGFVLAGGLIGLGFGFFIPTLQSLAVRGVPANRRGAATGTFFISMDLGIGLGTIVSGLVAEFTGYRTMFFATLVSLALAAVLAYVSRSARFRGLGGGSDLAPRSLEANLPLSDTREQA